MIMKDIKPFMDENGKISSWPAKKKKQSAVLAYLAAKFEPDRDYTEKEVNGIIDSWHTFGDYFLLRRELVDAGFISRVTDGSRYWRESQQVKDDGLF